MGTNLKSYKKSIEKHLFLSISKRAKHGFNVNTELLVIKNNIGERKRHESDIPIYA